MIANIANAMGAKVSQVLISISILLHNLRLLK